MKGIYVVLVAVHDGAIALRPDDRGGLTLPTAYFEDRKVSDVVLSKALNLFFPGADERQAQFLMERTEEGESVHYFQVGGDLFETPATPELRWRNLEVTASGVDVDLVTSEVAGRFTQLPLAA